MIQNETKNCCANCKHFIRHYVKRKAEIRSIQLGHCIRSARKRKFFALDDACELWEKCEISSEQQSRRDTKEALIDISYRLDEISAILQDDINK